MNDKAEDEPRLLTKPQELVFRQVHPSWLEDDIPSALAFKPTPKDEGMLSIALGSLTSPEGAFIHHTQDLELESSGTWGVTVEEVGEADRQAFAQPLAASPAHGFIDFRELSRKEISVASKLLLAGAKARGRLFPAPEPD